MIAPFIRLRIRDWMFSQKNPFNISGCMISDFFQYLSQSLLETGSIYIHCVGYFVIKYVLNDKWLGGHVAQVFIRQSWLGLVFYSLVDPKISLPPFNLFPLLCLTGFFFKMCLGVWYLGNWYGNMTTVYFLSELTWAFGARS